MRRDIPTHSSQHPQDCLSPEQGEEQAWKSKESAGAGLEGELCTALIQVFPSQAANCQNRFSRSFPCPRQPCCLSEPCESWRLRWEVEAGNCSPTHTGVACSRKPQLGRVEKEGQRLLSAIPRTG